MIEQKKISQISNKIQKQGGKKVPETVLERDYWLLGTPESMHLVLNIKIR
jgi:hypothetical protein